MRSCASRPGNGLERRWRSASGSEGIVEIVQFSAASPKERRPETYD